MKKPTCRDCGGKIVHGLDLRRVCPECRRLREFVSDLQEGRYKTDHINLGNGNYRRFAHGGT